MSRFTSKRLITATALVALLGTAAYASSVHLKGGPNSKPAFTDLMLTLRTTGALAGLGFGDVLVGLSATANATATCSNGANHQPPGQNPAPITVSGSEAIPASEVQNGNVSFSVTTNPPVTPLPGAPGCPNSKNWTEDITDLSFTSATITVQQGTPLATVLTVTCMFSPATTDGPVPSGTVSCTSS